MYDDIFSLIRGQGHAIENLEDGAVALSHMKSELERLFSQWKTLENEERKERVALLSDELSHWQTYEEILALEDRIEKIGFSHPERDANRVLGAFKGIVRAFESKIAKAGVLANGKTVLKTILNSESSALKTFFREFFETIGATPFDERASDAAWRVFRSKIWTVSERYLRCMEKTAHPCEPFESFRFSLRERIQKIAEIPEALPGQTETLKLVDFLKIHWFRIAALHWLQDAK